MELTRRYETISARSGGTFEAYCSMPASNGCWPGVLVFQEIFGINDNMRSIADRVAQEGYVALVPDMFWRIEPRFERKDESGMGDAFAMVQQFDFNTALEDIESAHAHLLTMKECSGKVGAIGFCLGGGLAFAAATTSRPDGTGPDAAVCYYGSPVNDLLDTASALECPSLFHYGNTDAFISQEKIAEVEGLLAHRPGMEFHRYDAGHAFSNEDAPSMYDKAAADVAWGRTIEFLARHLN